MREQRNSPVGAPAPTEGLHEKRGGLVTSQYHIGTRKPPLKWGNNTNARFHGQDKKSFGDQGILSFEQAIKRVDRTTKEKEKTLLSR